MCPVLSSSQNKIHSHFLVFLGLDNATKGYVQVQIRLILGIRKCRSFFICAQQLQFFDTPLDTKLQLCSAGVVLSRNKRRMQLQLWNFQHVQTVWGRVSPVASETRLQRAKLLCPLPGKLQKVTSSSRLFNAISLKILKAKDPCCWPASKE